jgi:hypothetical protein
MLDLRKMISNRTTLEVGSITKVDLQPNVTGTWRLKVTASTPGFNAGETVDAVMNCSGLAAVIHPLAEALGADKELLNLMPDGGPILLGANSALFQSDTAIATIAEGTHKYASLADPTTKEAFLNLHAQIKRVVTKTQDRSGRDRDNVAIPTMPGKEWYAAAEKIGLHVTWIPFHV